MVNEEDQEARPALIGVGLAVSRKNMPTSLVPDHVRDERVTRLRFCEKLTPEQRIASPRIVLFVALSSIKDTTNFPPGVIFIITN